jgi:hypothetical protein
MAKRKDYIDYSRFDYYLDALDLQTQTVRKSFKYDALEGVDEYTAYVLTSPIPENLSSLGALYSSIPEANESTSAVSDDSLPKYSFKARIIDANSPHSFLPDPCDIALSTDLTEQRLIKDLINLHITVFASSFTERPKVGNYVRIRLAPGAFVYDTKVAHLVEVLTDGSKHVMANLDDLKKNSSGAASKSFEGYTGTTLQHPDTRQLGAIYNGEEVLNGRFDPGLLASPRSDLYRASFTARFIPEAIESFEKLAEEYKKEFGEVIWLSDSYRDYGNQVRLRSGGFGARPGSSNHGWGVAFDVNGTNVDVDKDGERGTKYDRFNSKVYKWLDNGGSGRHGWINPPSLRETGRLPESWHWENTTIRDQYIKQRQQLPNYAIPDGEEEAPNA